MSAPKAVLELRAVSRVHGTGEGAVHAASPTRTRWASPAGGRAAVGGLDLARAPAGPDVPTAVLDRGGVLAEEGTLRPDGTALLVVHSHDPQGDSQRRVSVPAAAPAPGARRQVVLSEAAARALSMTAESSELPRCPPRRRPPGRRTSPAAPC